MPDTEIEAREAIIKEALTWVKTPYHISAQIKGVGVDCLTFLRGVYGALGYNVPEKIPYTKPGFFLNMREEIYLLGYDGVPGMFNWAREIPGPPKKGDIVLYRFGRIFAHAGIVIDWPWIIHAFDPHGVITTDGTQGKLAAKVMKFFTVF
jgi:cell wall-associated NlpC family hydrolase